MSVTLGPQRQVDAALWSEAGRVDSNMRLNRCARTGRAGIDGNVAGGADIRAFEANPLKSPPDEKRRPADERD